MNIMICSLNSAENFPPPSHIGVDRIQQTSLHIVNMSFNWTQVAPDCNDIQYSLTSTCGQCLAMTKLTMVTCEGIEFSTSGRMTLCSFMVKTVVCGNNESTGSNYESLQIKLKGIII